MEHLSTDVPNQGFPLYLPSTAPLLVQVEELGICEKW